jgi:hypothetical protein
MNDLLIAHNNVEDVVEHMEISEAADLILRDAGGTEHVVPDAFVMRADGMRECTMQLPMFLMPGVHVMVRTPAASVTVRSAAVSAQEQQRLALGPPRMLWPEGSLYRECLYPCNLGNMELLGRFWIPKSTSVVRRTLLSSLSAYFTTAKLRDVLLPLIDQKHPQHLSLRVITWCVTNYAKAFGMCNPGKDGSIVNIEIDYERQLTRYGCRNFAPFRRDPAARIFFELDGVAYETTTAQLNFTRWAELRDVLDYTRRNLAAITQNQDESMRANQARKTLERASGAKASRRELSKKRESRCFMFDAASLNMTLEIRFDPEVVD